MCDFFWQRMENYNQGDLADIVRAGGGGGGGSSSPKKKISDDDDNWQFIHSSELPSLSDQDHFNIDHNPAFSNVMDPFVNELSSISSFLEADVQRDHSPAKPMNMLSRQLQPSNNVYSKMFQISPPPPPSPINIGAGSTSDLMGGAVQISSSRSSPTIKRRKSQAKKVVCIPAPAAASNRPSSGEVVPSDLWAWRKYGQKPIKGSPYPRGYYRCSSSKGCSARKQVERSRNDPNMLVITYTSEHNHPWPTQRNALAGSTRSQLSKNTSSSSAPKNNINPADNQLKAHDQTSTSSSTSAAAVPPLMIKDEVLSSSTTDQSYRPMIQESAHDDFFADLAELESDPMRLIFSKDQKEMINKEPLMDDDDDDNDDDDDDDPFSMLDSWGAENSFGEVAKGGL